MIVTHEVPKIFEIVQKVAMLYEGTILTEGTPAEILASDNPVVQQFVAGNVDGPMQYF
jgi:phospholipid/cholesterol/gamma-HCH transport system ATP-binding protein